MSQSNRSCDALPRIPPSAERPLAAGAIRASELVDEIKLAPPVELVVTDSPLGQPVVELDAIDDEMLPEPSRQFTLRDIMLITLLAAAGFGVLRLCPPAMFAGAMGGIAILGLAVLTIAKPERAIFHLIWWTVLGIYIISSVIAVIRK